MNILVTGGAGYIGSICSEVLLSRGYGVVSLDNLVEGHRAAVPPGAVFCHADLAVRTQIEEIFAKHKIDARDALCRGNPGCQIRAGTEHVLRREHCLRDQLAG